MKKLLLLAVVILGFAATSFCQTSHPANVTVMGQVTIGAGANASFAINSMNALDFGDITNNATAGNNAKISIWPNGTINQEINMTHGGAPKPALFKVTGADTQILDTDITLTGNVQHTGNVFFDTSSGGTTNSNITGNYTSITAVSGLAKAYWISVGGVLELNNLATGAITISGLTLTVNNH
jgi:hypothetical protein